MIDKRKQFRLEYTDATFVFAGKSYSGIPLLVDSKYHFVAPVCDYLRSLVIYEHLETSSVKGYAQTLMLFWKFLEQRALKFREFGDKDLIEWLNSQEASVEASTLASRCDVVFEFYTWMELAGYIKGAVKIAEHDDGDKQPRIPQLSSRKARRTGQYWRRSRYGIVSGVRPNSGRSAVQATPNDDDVTSLYIAADNSSNPGLTERNHLLIDWYVQVGLRRMEWASLTTEQIPSWAEIDRCRGSSEAHEMHLTKTKGRGSRYVGVLPDLMEKTREYIEGTRLRVVERWRRKRQSGYSEPVEIFLSHKTGRSLELRAITNLLTELFDKAGVKGHGHRLRAVFLTRLFEAEYEAQAALVAARARNTIDWDLILTKVAERAGHRDPQSLRAYVTTLKKRRARAATDGDVVPIRQYKTALVNEIAVLQHRRDALIGTKKPRSSGTANSS